MELKFGENFNENMLRETHPDLMQALDELRAGGEVIYCNPCDGLRLKQHTCRCWHCQAELKNPNPDCGICKITVDCFPKEIM